MILLSQTSTILYILSVDACNTLYIQAAKITQIKINTKHRIAKKL